LKSPKTLHEAIQAALRAEAAKTKIETTEDRGPRSSTMGRRKIRMVRPMKNRGSCAKFDA
jgi:hypothetical protein